MKIYNPNSQIFTKKVWIATLSAVVSASVLAFLTSGCGKSSSGDVARTTTGNPPGSVSLQSGSYSTALSASLLDRLSFQATVSEFKFCITKLKLKSEDGAAVKDSTGSESIETKLGWIDISNSAVATKWGDVTMPVGFNLKELSVEIHKDAELCPASTEYSMLFNGDGLKKDLEFKFEFSPVVSVASGDTLTLSLGTIAKALSDAATAGKLNDEEVSSYLEGKSGSGQE